MKQEPKVTLTEIRQWAVLSSLPNALEIRIWPDGYVHMSVAGTLQEMGGYDENMLWHTFTSQREEEQS
jgi:hypothetical protein